MRLIDRYAYSNRLRGVDPASKAGLSLLVIALCLALDRPAVGLQAAACMGAVAVLRAGIPAAVFGKLLLAESFFLSLGTAGVAFDLTTAPTGSGWWGWSLGPLWLGCSPDSLYSAARVSARAIGAAAAMNFLALTTPMVDLLDLLRRARVPSLLIDLMTLVYRFIFTLLDSLLQMHTAQASRLGYVNWRRGMASAGVLAARLLVNTYHRARHLEIALESRGYTDGLRVLPSDYRDGGRLSRLGIWITAGLLLTGILT